MDTFLKLCSCLLILCILLTGCSTDKEFDPETATDYAEIQFHMNYWEVTNAEEEYIHFKRKENGDCLPKLEGTMGHYNEVMFFFDPSMYFVTPFSEFFTVQTRLPTSGSFNFFDVDFYKGGRCIGKSSVGGSFEGTATLHADGVIELLGNNTDFHAYITPQGESEYHEIKIEGSGERHVKLQLVDGEFVAEGMVGEYTVTKYNSEGEEISVETFQGKEPASDS